MADSTPQSQDNTGSDSPSPATGEPSSKIPQTLVEALAIIQSKDAHIAQLNAEAAQKRHQRNEAQEMVTSLKQELDSFKKQFEEAQKSAREAQQKAERQGWVSELANKFKLPPAIAQRLQGSTLEEMTADAEALSKELPQQPTQQPPRLPVGNNADKQKISRDALTAMTPEEYAALTPEQKREALQS